MLSSSRTANRKRFTRKAGGVDIQRHRLFFQQLEDRRLLAVFTVTSDADAGVGTLRQAILDANGTAAADEIVFDAALNGATIDLSTGELPVTEPLAIDASGLSGGVTIDAQYGSRVFNVDDSDPAAINVTFNGLTITRGKTTSDFDHGGGIRSFENLTLVRCTVSSNSTTGNDAHGGGIFSFGGNLTASSTTISRNLSAGDGGGMNVQSGDLHVASTTVSYNGAIDGGGIWIFTDLVGSQTAVMTNSTISGNLATGSGGGLFNYNGPTVIQNSTITDNIAPPGQGSGVASYADTLTETNVVSSIISGNAHDSDVDWIRGSTNSFQSSGYNLIGGGNALGAFGPLDQTNVTDPGLLPLANNGGPTQTHALLLSSLAVDTGINPLGLTHDQRGAPFLRQDIGFPVDVGAFEWQTSTFPLIVDTTADELDGDYGVGDLELREAINAANGFYGYDAISFDTAVPFSAPQTIGLSGGQLEITDSVTIDGPGANRLAIDAQGNSRVFNIDDGDFFGLSHVTLHGLTITGGRNDNYGGGILSRENLVLTDTTISDNASGQGGGIFDFSGDLTVTNSTISGNFSTVSGGGIWNYSSSVIYQTTITNSTISGNGTNGIGGGLFNLRRRTAIANSTITQNYAPPGHGSGVVSYGDSSTPTDVVSSIISGNALDSDVDWIGGSTNSFQSSGYNLIGGGNALGAFGPLDQTNVTDPGLLPLANNGGPTQTHALLLSSLAVDTGINPLGLTHDQRGAPFLRQDLGFPVDVGAFEWQTSTFPLIVDTPVDELDDDYSVGDLSLREAINAANGFVNHDVISFDPGVFGTQQTIGLTGGQLEVTDSVTIDAPGADRLAIDAQGNSRVLYINDGLFGAETHVTLQGLTITGGRITSDFEDGGGILNRENLTLNGCNVSRNIASGLYADGGAIYNSVAGNLTVSNTTISNNSSAFRGGGVFNNTYSAAHQTTIINSTISGNAASVFGGGLFNRGGLFVIQNSTITDNEAATGGGSGVASLANAYALTEVASSIISGNAHDSDVDFVDGGINTFASSGYNLIGEGNALAVFNNHDQTYVTDPRLVPLADNGGSTLTHALLPGSPAIDRGHPLFVPPPDFDQRGAPFDRVSNGRVDVGAFEVVDGDFDNDGGYTCADVDALVAEIAAGTNNPIYDLNSDSMVDHEDLAEWLVAAGEANLPSHNPYLFGDANLDGVVDGLDFIAWNDNKFTSVAAWCSGDFNADGVVDGLDFIVWNDNKFQSAGAQPRFDRIGAANVSRAENWASAAATSSWLEHGQPASEWSGGIGKGVRWESSRLQRGPISGGIEREGTRRGATNAGSFVTTRDAQLRVIDHAFALLAAHARYNLTQAD